MVRRKQPVPSRDAQFRWLAKGMTLVTAGIVGGFLLGELVAGDGLYRPIPPRAALSGLGGNPDARETDQMDWPRCLDCPDSYGVAARMKSARAYPADDAFRRLGHVDTDQPMLPAPIDDYQYGGRFPDPPPHDPPRNSAPSPDASAMARAGSAESDSSRTVTPPPAPTPKASEP